MKVQERERMSQPARMAASSLDNAEQNEKATRQVHPSEGGRKLFSEMMKDGGDKRYKITLKAKNKSQLPSRSNAN
jgi:hypothetical protein